MENRLKERLTGAAILVALIVLVVPELFHGRHPAAPSSPADEASPEHSFTIDLNGSPAPSHAGGGPSAEPPVQRPPAPPAGPPATDAEAAPAAKATPAAKAPPAAKAMPAKTSPGRGWTVQLGLFAKPANAQRLLRSAQSHGFSAHVSRYGAKALYRVTIGGLADRTAAEQVARRLRGAGLPAAILGPR